MITSDSIEEKLINLQTFKKYIANNIVDRNNIHETNLNVNNFMESFEEFKTTNIKQKQKSKKSRYSIIDEEDDKNEELEIEYLKKLI